MLMMKKRKLENGMEHNIRFSLKPCSKTCLCDDIVSTILLKLPVKSLLRFTSVSKSWNSLILSPTFIATYNKLIRRRRYLLYTPGKPRLGSPFFTSADDEQRSNIKMPKDSCGVVGSCDGLVCVQNIHSQVYLWNPLLQTYKTIPPSPSQGTTTTNSSIELGFGYSSNNNDHKIVKIIYSEGFTSAHNKVEIYSLKYNSWKSIDSTAQAMPLGAASVYINGCINWLAINTSRAKPVFTIMWFDIDKELFGEKELLTIPKDCEEECHCSSSSLCSMWKRKALACENSSVLVQLRWRDQLEVRYAKIFDGEILFRTECKNMINFLGVNAVTPLEKKDVRMSEFFNVVCVSESLMLLGHKDE